MLDEIPLLKLDDVIIPDKELLQMLMCTNNEVLRFCDYYSVNIWTFVDLTFYESHD